MNFAVAEAEAMPNIAANSVSVLFGDFRRGYLIVDRAGVRILRDPSRPSLRAVLHHQAGGRRRAGLRRDQGTALRGVTPRRDRRSPAA